MTETLSHEAEDIDYRPVDVSDHYVNQIENGRVGFGHGAVHAAIAQTTNRLLERELLDGAFDDLVLKEQTTTREELGKLSEKNRGRFNTFLNSRPSSSWVDEQLGFEPAQMEEGEKPVKDYVGKLLEPSPDGYKVSDEQFQHFLEWHNHELRVMQEEIEPMMSEQKKLYLGKLHAAIDQGWIPEWVNAWAENRIQETPVVVDDGFITSHHGFAGEAKRVSILQKEEVIIDPEHLDTAEWVLTHEFTHVIDGYYENADFDGYSRGLYKLVPGHLKGGNYLNEAIVEHLSDSMRKDNNIDVIDPDSPLRQGATYVVQRKLLNILATKGKQPIDVRDFIAAHFDDGKRDRVDGNGETPTGKLHREIEEAFPDEDVLGQLAEIENEQQLIILNMKLGVLGRKYEKQRENRRFVKQLVAAMALTGTLTVGAMMEIQEAMNMHHEHEQSSVPSSYGERGTDTDSQSSNNAPGPGTYSAPDNSNSVTIPVTGHR